MGGENGVHGGVSKEYWKWDSAALWGICALRGVGQRAFQCGQVAFNHVMGHWPDVFDIRPVLGDIHPVGGVFRQEEEMPAGPDDDFGAAMMVESE